MTRLAELRALLAPSTKGPLVPVGDMVRVEGSNWPVAQFGFNAAADADLFAAMRNTYEALLDVAEAADEIFGHLALSSDLNEANPTLFRLVSAIGRIKAGTDGTMRSDK